MINISRELQGLLERETIAGFIRAYLYSAVISCGPWIISILSIVVLGLLLKPLIESDQIQVLMATITHVYAFSLILVGPMQLVLTRYAADQLSHRTPGRIVPSMIASLGLVAVISGIVGSIFFFAFVPGTLLYKISAAALMVYVSSIFVVANYLSTIQNYASVVGGFGVGYVLSCVGAYIGVTNHSIGAGLAGFAAGHLILFLLLVYSLRRELGVGTGNGQEVFSYFKRFPMLLFCGLFYNLGIWIDKLMFWWFSDQHQQIAGSIYAAPEYDVAIYLSLLAIAPGMAIFFMHLQTNFSEKYARFFRLVRENGSLGEIQDARTEIIGSLREGFLRLFKVQGLVTITLVIFAHKLAVLVDIDSIQLGIFRVTLFGTFLLVIFLSLLTTLFYFDSQKSALLCAVVFVICNASLSVATLLSNERWYGFGFVIAAGVALMLAAQRVNQRLRRLEYHVFNPQEV